MVAVIYTGRQPDTHTHTLIHTPKIRHYCVGVDILVIFFNSIAKTLVNYSEFWYLSRIFHSLFYKLISIIIHIPPPYNLYQGRRQDFGNEGGGKSEKARKFDTGSRARNLHRKPEVKVGRRAAL